VLPNNPNIVLLYYYNYVVTMAADRLGITASLVHETTPRSRSSYRVEFDLIYPSSDVNIQQVLVKAPFFNKLARHGTFLRAREFRQLLLRLYQDLVPLRPPPADSAFDEFLADYSVHVVLGITAFDFNTSTLVLLPPPRRVRLGSVVPPLPVYNCTWTLVVRLVDCRYALKLHALYLGAKSVYTCFLNFDSLLPVHLRPSVNVLNARCLAETGFTADELHPPG
jgi:hypothetical protein